MTLSRLLMLNLLAMSGMVRSSSPGATEKASTGMPDPFVQNAPLIIGATCRDGVVLVGAHTSDDDEPLLYRGRPIEPDDSESPRFMNLPENFCGPFRIQQIDAAGIMLLCTGWRADCDSLTEVCRSLAKSEYDTFGVPQSMLEYGQNTASDLSTALAEYATEGGRPLSCVALLASSGESCGLWLVDALNAYRVRAHCIGGGFVEGVHVATLLNSRLCQQDFADLSQKETIRSILALLSGSTDGETKSPLFGFATRLEIATMGRKSRFTRVQLESTDFISSKA